MMISEKLYQLCRSEQTVSSELAEDLAQSPGTIVKRLYGENTQTPNVSESASSAKQVASPEDLQRAYECGKWGATRPSDLFLRVSLSP